MWQDIDWKPILIILGWIVFLCIYYYYTVPLLAR